MERIKNLSDLPHSFSYGLVMGNFDGVHKGHQDLLEKIRRDCTQRKIQLVVATFIPHPRIFFTNKKNILINSYQERRDLMRNQGVDRILEFDFNRDFALLSPEKFLENYLISQRGLKAFYMGHNFTFGAKRAGHYGLVRDYCIPKGIEVCLLDEFQENGQKVSSNVIRGHLAKGEMATVNKLLGRPFFITGKIKKGMGRGRHIGFLTANLDFESDRFIPSGGVYATKVKYREREYLSITNIGHNPTFGDSDQLNIETNIFDFNKNIYGETISIQFFEKIRDERKFESVSDLRERIKIDCGQRRFLN